MPGSGSPLREADSPFLRDGPFAVTANAFSAETSSLEPGQSIRVDGQQVRSSADAALWYAVRRAVLQEYRDAFVKEGYQAPSGVGDLIVAADARARRLQMQGQAPLGDDSMVSALNWLDAYLEAVHACDHKMDSIAADRYRATQAELERVAQQAERLKPQLRAAQRTAFRAGSNSRLKQAAEAFATLLDNTLAMQELVRDGAAQMAEMRALGTALRAPQTLRVTAHPWHELMRATTRAKLGKLLGAAQGLNKILAGWQLLDGSLALLAGGKTASDRASGGVSFAATIASAGGTLLGASSVFSLYNNLYLGPMVKRILGQVDVLKDQLSTGRNHPYIQLGRLDNVDWSIEPGGREMFEFMRAAMKAGSASAVPALPATVARYFSKHKKAFDAGTPRRHGVDINHDDFSDKRQWVFAFRDDLWGMLYGALPVPG